MPERPFFKKSIDELETMYNQGQADKKLVKLILSELEHRNRPKAKKLKKTILEAKPLPLLDVPADPALFPDDPPPPRKDLWESITKAISGLKH